MQGRQALKKATPDGVAYCCLGVACHLFAEELDVKITTRPNDPVIMFDDASAFLPEKIADVLNAKYPSGEYGDVMLRWEGAFHEISTLNDVQHLSFAQIALLIRDHYKLPSE